jgi:hypothetical protein
MSLIPTTDLLISKKKGIYRQQGELTSLLLFFQNKEYGLKNTLTSYSNVICECAPRGRSRMLFNGKSFWPIAYYITWRLRCQHTPLFNSLQDENVRKYWDVGCVKYISANGQCPTKFWWNKNCLWITILFSSLTYLTAPLWRLSAPQSVFGANATIDDADSTPLQALVIYPYSQTESYRVQFKPSHSFQSSTMQLFFFAFYLSTSPHFSHFFFIVT